MDVIHSTLPSSVVLRECPEGARDCSDYRLDRMKGAAIADPEINIASVMSHQYLTT
jgi:hypothetical protein